MLCSGRVFGLSTVGLWISLGALRLPKDRPLRKLLILRLNAAAFRLGEDCGQEHDE
jgi:hypothetical protein